MTHAFGLTPSDHKLSAEELLILFAKEDRHSNALGYEMRRTLPATLIRLADGSLADVPDALSSAAYDELKRRETAFANLRAATGLRL